MDGLVLYACLLALFFILVISHGFALGFLAFILIIAICLVIFYIQSHSDKSNKGGDHS